MNRSRCKLRKDYDAYINLMKLVPQVTKYQVDFELIYFV